MADADGKTADDIALGLMAGWDVQALVSSAGFYSAAISGTYDASALAAALLTRPLGRSVLLDPDAERVALGSVVASSPKTLAAVIATYQGFGTRRPDENARTVLARLNRAREKHGRQPFVASDSLGRLAGEAAERVNTRQMDPGDALREALRAASRSMGRPVRGFWSQASDLDEMPFSKPLLEGPEASVGISVGIHAPIQEPWARWTAFIIIPDSRQTATRRGNESPVLAAGRY